MTDHDSLDETVSTEATVRAERVENSLLTRNRESREAELTRGRSRRRKLRQADVGTPEAA